jgi:hypothetical protein
VSPFEHVTQWYRVPTLPFAFVRGFHKGKNLDCFLWLDRSNAGLKAMHDLGK